MDVQSTNFAKALTDLEFKRDVTNISGKTANKSVRKVSLQLTASKMKKRARFGDNFGNFGGTKQIFCQKNCLICNLEL